MYLSIRKFCHFISSHICIAMHFILVKMFHNLVLLINNPSKRGDMETLVRSSISPPPQVKTKLKIECLQIGVTLSPFLRKSIVNQIISKHVVNCLHPCCLENRQMKACSLEFRRQHVSNWYRFRTGIVRVLILPHT